MAAAGDAAAAPDRLAIRAAAPADDDAIWSILRPAIEAGDTFTADPDGGRAGALAYWRPPGADTFVAAVAGRILGTSYLKPNQPGGGAHVCNAGYATAPEARGRGVARALLAHALATARARGFRAMQFNFVVATNTRAVDTWERAGFGFPRRRPAARRLPPPPPRLRRRAGDVEGPDPSRVSRHRPAPTAARGRPAEELSPAPLAFFASDGAAGEI